MLSASWRRASILVGWAVFVCATENWRPWADGIRLQYATDELQYETIARAAPGLPDVKIDPAHADRFAAHWLVGELAHGLHAGLHPVYWSATGVVLVAMLITVALTLRDLAAPWQAEVLVLGAVAASAYPVRFALVAPGMLSDTLFVLGLTVTVWGAVTRRPPLAIGGLALATVGREMGVVLGIVVACIWLLEPRTRRWAPAALLVPAVLFTIFRSVATSFSEHARGVLGMTVAGSWTLHTGLSHAGRAAVAVALVSSVVALAWWRGKRAPLLMPLALGAAVVAQALVLAPDWTHSEPRLAGAAVPALAVAAVPGLAHASLRGYEVAVAALGIALASLHHLYTDVGVDTARAWGALVALGCLLVLAPAIRRARPATQPGR